MITRLFAYLFIFCLLALLAWPLYVSVGWFISHLAGEGSLLTTWHLEPKRNFLNHFLEGYQGSAPIAVAMSAVAVVCIMALKRFGFAASILLLCFPAFGYFLAIDYFNASQASLLHLIATGLIFTIATLILSTLIKQNKSSSRHKSHKRRRSSR